MSMTVNDSIFGPPRGDPEVAIQRAAARGALGPYAAFIREIFRVAPLMPEPIDPACAVAQSSQETGYWSIESPYWVNDLNPGGIGIWRDGEPSPFNPPGVQTGEQAARLMLLEIWAHLRPTPSYPSVVQDMVAIDGWLDEVQTAQRDPNRPPMQTLKDWHLQYTSSTGSQECTWACDPNYSQRFVERGNYLFPDLPSQTGPSTELEFGQVKHPDYDDSLVGQTIAYETVAPRENVGTCVHRMVGTLRGTDGYFKAIPPGGFSDCPADVDNRRYGACHGLTDYGIGGAVDAPQDDGRILRWNDPRGTRAPTANGNTFGLEGDGPAFVDAYPDVSINANLVSIELSGNQTTPMTPNQIDSLANLIAYWHDQARVPYTDFPINPATGVSTQMYHYEFTNDKDCPWAAVRDRTNEIHNKAREIMRLAQTNGVPNPEEPDPGDPESPVSPQFRPTDRINVLQPLINLRSAPSINAVIVANLTSGSQLCVRSGPTSSDGYSWYEVRVVSTGVLGYVAGELCGLEQAQACGTTGNPTPPGVYSLGDRIAIAVEALNIRAQPSTDAMVTGSFYGGSNVCVADGPLLANGFEWYEVEAGNQRGWVASEYTELYQSGGCGTGTPSGRFSVGDRIRVSDGDLNIRTEPTTSASIVYYYLTGAEICVTGGPVVANGFEWYAVDGYGYQGWVAGDFCVLAQTGGCQEIVAGKFRTTDQIQVLQDQLLIRALPTTSATVIGQYEIWTELCVVSGPAYANGFEWYEVSGYGYQGWIAGDYCALLQSGGCTATPPATWTHQVTNGPLNLRSASNTSAPVIGLLPNGTRLRVISGPVSNQGYAWYNVEAEGFGTGWCVNGFLPI